MERDRAQEHDERRRAWEQAGGHADAQEAARSRLTVIVMVVVVMVSAARVRLPVS